MHCKYLAAMYIEVLLYLGLGDNMGHIRAPLFFVAPVGGDYKRLHGVQVSRVVVVAWAHPGKDG